MKPVHLVALGLLSASAALAQTAPAPIQLQHIDVAVVDKSVNPCDNFYQYACGIQNREAIPADQVSWGGAMKLSMWNRQVLRGILEANQAANPARTPNQQKIGDLYASCVQQADTSKDDVAAIRPLEARIAALTSRAGIATTLASLQLAVSNAYESGDNQTSTMLLGFGPTPDANDTSRIVAGVDQAGLGLGNRDYYTKDDEHTVAIRKAYITLITKLLTLDGMKPEAAAASADTVLRVETVLAKAQMDNITRRDPNKINNRYTLAQLKALTPNFNWDAYFRTLGAPASPLYEVSSPEFFKVLNTELATESLATWKTYFRAHVLLDSASNLGNAWRDAAFPFVQTLSGMKVQPPVWRRCSASVDVALGEALGQVYIEKVFTAESKARALAMVKNIEAAMSRDIDAATWMQPATKKEAHAKLAAVIEKIGYPDHWRDYSSLTITRDSYPANMQRATTFEFHRQLATIGKPLDKTKWDMTPPTLNAYEDPQTNTINFPAGILAAPFFDATQSDAVNYGAIGVVMGHELTHDFDDQGRKFDVKGNLRDWWTPEDSKAYDERGSCIADEYTGPVPGFSDLKSNGRLTQGEDTADNGGAYLSLAALTQSLMASGKSLSDKDATGLTNLQRFFIGYANDWCGKTRPEAERQQVLTNPHSVRENRVNNVVGNMPEFDEAFGCKAGQPMVHKTQCRVW